MNMNMLGAKKLKSGLLIFALFLIPIALSGCFPSLGGGGRAPAAGEFVKGGIVKGFPGTVPLYKEAVVVESYGDKDSYGASFITSDDLAKVVNYYNTALGTLGWNSELRQVSET